MIALLPDDPGVYAFGRLPADSTEWGPCDVGQRMARRLTNEREIDSLVGRHSELWYMMRGGSLWVRPETAVEHCGYGGGPPCESAEQYASRLETARLAAIGAELWSLYDDDEDEYDTGY